jgi:hypothetical protein
VTYVIEIAVPFLFFAPVRGLKRFAFYSQVSQTNYLISELLCKIQRKYL